MTLLQTVQDEHKVWRARNFPGDDLWVPALGAAEETGELCHAVLKMYQGIRGTEAEHKAAMEDAIGDVSLYLIDICSMLGLSFEQVVYDTWQIVKQRDWQANKGNGVDR